MKAVMKTDRAATESKKEGGLSQQAWLKRAASRSES